MAYQSAAVEVAIGELVDYIADELEYDDMDRRKLVDASDAVAQEIIEMNNQDDVNDLVIRRFAEVMSDEDIDEVASALEFFWKTYADKSGEEEE